MVFVGAFLGGSGGAAIPAGHSQLNLSWVTTDGKNISGVVFTITGPINTSVTADNNGQASLQVPVGTYVVSVQHNGIYEGDESKTITCENKTAHLLTWVATRIRAQVTLVSPINITYEASYSIVNDSGETLFSEQNIVWSNRMTFLLYTSAHTLTLTIGGHTQTFDFMVEGDSSIDISSIFCRVDVNYPVELNFSVTYDGVEQGEVSSFHVLKGTSSKTVTFSGGPSYGGVVTTPVMTLNSVNLTPSSDSLTISPVATASVVTVVDNGTLEFPFEGQFHVLLIGGGGYGGTCPSGSIYPCGGGGSGRVSDTTITIPAGPQTVTIGAGGTSSAGAGKATSLGSLLSVSGGSIGSNSSGGAGGAGGGGGMGDPGGKGEQYGGGGGGGKRSGASGGSGGTGVTANGGSGSSGTAGGTGLAVSSNDPFYGSSYYNAAGGSVGGNDGGGAIGGGGGGGGHGARGGNGAYSSGGSTPWTQGGGGGGGGVAGGNGGNGGTTGGKGGYGYGAGGGGCGIDYIGNSTEYGGGGGGGGLGTTKISGNGGSKSGQNSTAYGGSGAKGAIRIQWVMA